MPRTNESRGCNRPSNQRDLGVIGIEFICICSTGVITIGGNKLIACFMVQIMHRNLYEILPSPKAIQLKGDPDIG